MMFLVFLSRRWIVIICWQTQTFCGSWCMKIRPSWPPCWSPELRIPTSGVAWRLRCVRGKKKRVEERQTPTNWSEICVRVSVGLLQADGSLHAHQEAGEEGLFRCSDGSLHVSDRSEKGGVPSAGLLPAPPRLHLGLRWHHHIRLLSTDGRSVSPYLDFIIIESC